MFELSLAERLFLESTENSRCPNLRRDQLGVYCARDLKSGEKIIQGRRNVCDHISLRLWCLDKGRYSKCIWYQGEPFR
jgi:hypothetical protein